MYQVWNCLKYHSSRIVWKVVYRSMHSDGEKYHPLPFGASVYYYNEGSDQFDNCRWNRIQSEYKRKMTLQRINSNYVRFHVKVQFLHICRRQYSWGGKEVVSWGLRLQQRILKLMFHKFARSNGVFYANPFYICIASLTAKLVNLLKFMIIDFARNSPAYIINAKDDDLYEL